MKYVPSTVVISVLLLIFVSWPSVEAWSNATLVHHFWVHCVYVLSGGIFGLQTARWMSSVVPASLLSEGGVSS